MGKCILPLRGGVSLLLQAPSIRRRVNVAIFSSIWGLFRHAGLDTSEKNTRSTRPAASRKDDSFSSVILHALAAQWVEQQTSHN